MSGIRQSKGMTLVEMMIAIGITTIVMTMSISIFVSQYGSYNRGKNVKEAQQSGQEVIGLLKYDLMQAGWSVTPQMAFNFQDGGANGSDMIVLNDTDIISLVTNPNSRALVMAGDCPGGLPMSGTGSSIITVQTLDIDGNGNADFLDGASQYVISDGIPKTAMIDTIGGNQLTLGSTLGGTLVAPGIFYCVDDTTNAQCRGTSNVPQYVLRKSGRGIQGRQPIAENVVDLQVAYADNNDAACSANLTQGACNGAQGCEWLSGRCTGFWYGRANCSGQGAGAGNAGTSGFCALAPFDPQQVTLVRLSVVARSSQLVDGSRTNIGYCRPALENHTAAAVGSTTDCGYVYRTYSTLVQPRSNR